MRASRKSLFKGFDACGAPANHSVKGLAFPRRAKVVSRKVWYFRAWRKSFPERFDLCRYVETTRNLQSAEDRKYRLHKAESLFDILTHDGNENPIAWIWRYRLKMLFLHKIGGARQIENKFSLRLLAQSLQKIGGVRQIENKFSLRSLAQSLFVALKR